jgi:hypothetical protein
MNTEYRPYFIAVSLFFLSVGAYFFVGLGNNFYTDTLKAVKITQNIKDLEIDTTRKSVSKEGRPYTIVSYQLVNKECPLKWELHIDSDSVKQNLSLHETTDPGACLKTESEVEDLNMSIFKKIIHQFDSKKLSHFSITKHIPRDYMNRLLPSLKLKAMPYPYRTDKFGRNFFLFIQHEGK